MIKNLLTKVFLKFVDSEFIIKVSQKTKIKQLREFCIIAKNSKFYHTSTIQNRQNNRKSIKILSNSHIKGNLMIMGYGGKIKIGNNTFVGENSNIWSGSEIIIGNQVLISHNVNIIDTNSHEINHLKRAEDFIKLTNEGVSKERGNIECMPIIIEDYAWINFNVVIQKGVKIGKGAIVAPSSVVINDVEPFTLVAGNPAKFIKKV